MDWLGSGGPARTHPEHPQRWWEETTSRHQWESRSRGTEPEETRGRRSSTTGSQHRGKPGTWYVKSQPRSSYCTALLTLCRRSCIHSAAQRWLSLPTATCYSVSSGVIPAARPCCPPLSEYSCRLDSFKLLGLGYFRRQLPQRTVYRSSSRQPLANPGAVVRGSHHSAANMSCSRSNYQDL